MQDDNAEIALKEHITFLDSILKYKNTFIKDILMPFGVAIIVIPIVYLIVTPSKKEILKKHLKENAEYKKEYNIGDIHSAWAYIEVYVENQLKSPSSSDFPFADYRGVTYVSDGLYTFKSYVDAKNSFNATIRTYFEGAIKRTKGKWKIVKFKFIRE